MESFDFLLIQAVRLTLELLISSEIITFYFGTVFHFSQHYLLKQSTLYV